MGKFLILLGGFGTTVISARIWGAEGRGIIAIYVANLELAAVLTNIFTNSSACFYAARMEAKRLWLQAFLWTLCVSFIASLFFYGGESWSMLTLFLITSTLMGMVTFSLSLELAREDVDFFNTVTVAQPLLALVLMLGIWQTFCSTYYAYFIAQTTSYVICVAVCHIHLCKHKIRLLGAKIEKECFKQNFLFGLQEEGGAFFKFLNYRLPYYFLLSVCGNASVGVFSIGVALSESVCVISRSISLVQYVHLLKPDQSHPRLGYLQTIKFAKYSLLLSFAVLLMAQLLPLDLYLLIFGEDFSDLKYVLILLTPGILSVSMTMVYSHYFSALGHLRNIWISSATGAVFALLASLVLVPRYGLTGAGIATSIAHLVNSGMLAFFMYRESRQ